MLSIGGAHSKVQVDNQHKQHRSTTFPSTTTEVDMKDVKGKSRHGLAIADVRAHGTHYSGRKKGEATGFTACKTSCAMESIANCPWAWQSCGHRLCKGYKSPQHTQLFSISNNDLITQHMLLPSRSSIFSSCKWCGVLSFCL